MEENIEVKSSIQVFNNLIEKDQNLNSSNLQQLRDFIFKPDTPIVDAIDILASLTSDHPMFMWPPEDGFQSVARRGFYKIISEIKEQEEFLFTIGGKYTSYKAIVIYSPNTEHKEYYRFVANIGPLINSLSVIFDLSPNRRNKVLKLADIKKDYYNKSVFLNELINKVFYVSLQQTTEKSFKQTFWFKLE